MVLWLCFRQREKAPYLHIYMESIYVFILSPYTYVDRETYLWVKWNDVWDLFLNTPGKKNEGITDTRTAK